MSTFNKLKFNPITSELDLVKTIPEVITNDPPSAKEGDAWVLTIPGQDGGEPVGLLLSLTVPAGVPTSYSLSYKTKGGVKRVTLS